MGTTESLLSYNEDDGSDNDDEKDFSSRTTTDARAQRLPSTPSSHERRRPPPPPPPTKALPQLPGVQAAATAQPRKPRPARAVVVSCRLSGLVVGREGSGKQTLLQRLQGRDPFVAVGEDRQRVEGPLQGVEAVDVPYQTSRPVLHDKITLSVRAATRVGSAGTGENKGTDGAEGASAMAAAKSAPGPAAVDFAVLLLHPKSDPRAAESYVKECVQQFLRLQGYAPNGSEEEAEAESPETGKSPHDDDSGNNNSNSHSASAAPPPLKRPVCLCLLLNFRDLKPSKHDKRKAKKKAIQFAGDSEAPVQWMSQSTVQQWVLEVLQLHDRSLDASQMLLKLGHASLYNCYGLGMLHSFVYQSYLCRQQYDALCRLRLVQSLLRNVAAASQRDDADAVSYEAYVDSLQIGRGGGDNDDGDSQQASNPQEIQRRRRPPPVASSDTHLDPSQQQRQQQQPAQIEPARSGGPRRAVVVSAHRRNSERDGGAAASAPSAPQSSAQSRVDPMEASRAALEAFLMDEDSDEDGDDRGSRNRRSAASKSTSTKTGKRNNRKDDEDDDDDDDDFFVEHLPASSRPPSPTIAPSANSTASRRNAEGRTEDRRSGKAEAAGASRDDSGEADAPQPSGTSLVANQGEDDETTATPVSAPSPGQVDAVPNAPDTAPAVNADPTIAPKENEIKPKEVERGNRSISDASHSPKPTAAAPDDDGGGGDADAAGTPPPLDPSVGADRNVTNGSNAPSLRANGNRHDIRDATRPDDPSKPQPRIDADDSNVHGSVRDDDDDDGAFVIRDTAARYPSTRTPPEARAVARPEPPAARNRADERATTTALSAAALAAVADAQREAERMLRLGPDAAPAATEARRAKQKKEKKPKKEKKGSRKDGSA